MNITPYILEEAKAILNSLKQSGLTLPVQLDSAKEFYLAEASDDTILAFTAFEFNGFEYKIGVRKI